MGKALIKQAGSGGMKIKFKNYGGPTLEKREAESLSQARYIFAATSVANYALFGGGHLSSDVDAYSTNLTHSTPTALNEKREYLTATAGQNYALFAGGERYNRKTDYYPNVDAYNADLVHSTATNLSEGRSRLAATTVGDYSLFAGGELAGNVSSDKVDAYDNSLAQTTATSLSIGRYALVATAVGNHAIFAGGYASGGTSCSRVDAYSSNLVRSTLADVTSYYCQDATTTGDYALFGRCYFTSVDVYNSNLIKLTPTNLSEGKSDFTATSVGSFALFGGGRYLNEKNYTTVEGFDNNLVLHQFEDLSVARGYLAATAVSNYALFGGGYASTYEATVDCYEYVEKDLELTLLKGAKYKFQNMSAEVTVDSDFSTISIPAPATGYIKFQNTTIS